MIVLGANGNLGKELICEFEGRDIDLIGIDKNNPINKSKIKNLICDLSKPDQILKTIDVLKVGGYEKVIVISTVGLFGSPSFDGDSFNDQDFCDSVAINLLGVCRFVANLTAKCLQSKVEKIRAIIVGSAAANVGSSDFGYGVAKAGLDGFVKSFSKALSSRGLVCIGVNPGIFESTMSKSVSLERQQAAIRATHIKRVGQINEISSVVRYLALEAPDYLTGSIIPINGGQYS